MKLKKQYFCIFLVIVIFICNSCSNREIIVISWPTYMVNMGGYTAEEQVELLKESNTNSIYSNSIYANDDGSITFEMNEKQLQSIKERFITNMEETIKEAKENEIIVDVSDDYKTIIFECSRDADLNIFMTTYALMTSSAAVLQMFLGEDPNDWHLKIKIINTDTDKIVEEGSIPDEEIRISPEDWAK